MRPLGRCLDESWALKAEREGKDGGSLAAAGLACGEAQATLRAARRLLISKNNTLRQGRPMPLAHLAHIKSIANQDASSI